MKSKIFFKGFREGKLYLTGQLGDRLNHSCCTMQPNSLRLPLVVQQRPFANVRVNCFKTLAGGAFRLKAAVHPPRVQRFRPSAQQGRPGDDGQKPHTSTPRLREVEQTLKDLGMDKATATKVLSVWKQSVSRCSVHLGRVSVHHPFEKSTF